jgi:large subunit ribosomal protein L10
VKAFMPTKEKEVELKRFREILDGAKSVVVSHASGLSVAEVTDLRKRLRDAGVTHTVVKNTLAKIAARDAKMEGLNKLLEGPTVISISKTDIIAPAKILTAFAKEHDKLVILGGIIEGKDATAKDVVEISTLPSREELLAKLLGSMNSPITGLVRVLNGPLQGFARVLHAIEEKKAAAGA